MQRSCSGGEKEKEFGEAFPIYVYKGKGKYSYNPNGSVDSLDERQRSESKKKLQYLLISKMQKAAN